MMGRPPRRGKGPWSSVLPPEGTGSAAGPGAQVDPHGHVVAGRRDAGQAAVDHAEPDQARGGGYAKLERGSLAGASAGVLDAIARALQLDDAERTHLLHLAHEADGSNAALRRRRPKPEAIRPGLQWSSSRTGTSRRTCVWQTCAPPPGRTPTTRDCTTSSESSPPATTSSAAAGEPTTSAPTAAGVKHFHHHVVGDLVLAYEGLDLRAEPGLTMTNYAAEPDSPTVHALTLLASSAAATTETSPTAIPTVAPGQPGRVGSVDV
jgi:hypothetical protein